ncbi:hypothetical protein ACFY05_32355 [Microtetraspora fusca]|uniref:DUF2530 domain-containing protein n=1 Tax=Microtetraspora fusca TaxID=1997 RepID=A0ABW6VDX7_MICFU
MSETSQALPSPVVVQFDPGRYPLAWAVWGGAVATSFAALETAACLSAPGPKTLSAQLRRKRWLSVAAIAAGAAWLVWHIGWEQPRHSKESESARR